MKKLQKRRSSLFANLKIGDAGSFSQSLEEDDNAFPFALDSSVKQWASMKEHRKCGGEENEEGVEEDCEGHWCRTSPRAKQSIINLNIGGRHFKISSRMAARYPCSRIGRLALCRDPVKKLALCDDYSVLTNEYFFDRDPTFFHYIFHFYRCRVLWITEELCPMNFEEEMEYWGLHIKYSPRCCRILFEEKKDEITEDLKIQRELLAQIEPEHDKNFEGMFLGKLRKNIWNLAENPYSSTWAKAFAIVASFFVLVSIVTMTLNTVDEISSGKAYIHQVETICLIFFTAEYLMGLVSTCNIKKFLLSPLNFVDLVAILPFYVQIAFEKIATQMDMNFNEDLETMEQVRKSTKVLKIIRLMRIFRILKLARHSTGLRAFGFTICQCYQQVCCLFLFIGMGIFSFSALMHSVEHDVPGTPFSSMPDAWWWAAVSISTVGYGDTVPESALGRIVAFGCISFGIILNGMPISILFNKFSDYYARLKAQECDANMKPRGKIRLQQRMLRRLSECRRPQTLDSDDESSSRSGGRS